MPNVVGGILLGIIILIPNLAMLYNFITFLVYFAKDKDIKGTKGLEVMGMWAALIYLAMYLDVSKIQLVSWMKQLYNDQRHSMIATEMFVTIVVIMGVAIIGYLIARFGTVSKQPPLLCALSVSAMYLGIAICIVWIIQVKTEIYLVLVGISYMLIFIKTICMVVRERHFSYKPSSLIPNIQH